MLPLQLLKVLQKKRVPLLAFDLTLMQRFEYWLKLLLMQLVTWQFGHWLKQQFDLIHLPYLNQESLSLLSLE